MLKLVGRIIPHRGGYDIHLLAAKLVFKACFGVHTRDFHIALPVSKNAAQ